MIQNKFYFKVFILCFALLFLTAYILFSTINISYASESMYVWSTQTKPLDETQLTNANLNTSLVNGKTIDLALQCGGAVLIEQHSGKVLYNHNMHEKLRPASVTKVMTLLLIMEQIDSGKLSYTDKIPCSENAARYGWLSNLA